jgi:hypothetical protein
MKTALVAIILLSMLTATLSLGACSRYETHHGDGPGINAGPTTETRSIPPRVPESPLIPEPTTVVHTEKVSPVVLPTPRPTGHSPKRKVLTPLRITPKVVTPLPAPIANPCDNQCHPVKD